MPTRKWAVSAMMDSVVPTARRRNVPLDLTFFMEMEVPKGAIAPAVEFAAMKLVCALVSRDTTEPGVNFRQFWKHHMVAAFRLLVLGEKGRDLSYILVRNFLDAMTTLMVAVRR